VAKFEVIYYLVILQKVGKGTNILLKQCCSQH